MNTCVRMCVSMCIYEYMCVCMCKHVCLCIHVCVYEHNNNNNLLHLYSAFLDTQSALHSKWAISSSTTNVQHPPG